MVADFKKNKNKSLFKKIILAVGGMVILSLLVFLIIANINVYKKRTELNSKIEDLKNRISDIKNSNEHLEQGILKTDNDEYIEKVAREELNLQKEGEKAVSFIMPDEKNHQNDLSKKNIFDSWLGWLGKIFKK